jgi:hypothetical protein
MRSSHDNKHGKAARLFALCAALCVFAAMPLLSSARVRSASISIANNSGRSIIHVYLSHTDADDWGPNQIGDSAIASGDSYTISNVSWDSSQIKVVAEDGNGCFFYGVVSGSGSSTWTIGSEAQADCGGGGR